MKDTKSSAMRNAGKISNNYQTIDDSPMRKKKIMKSSPSRIKAKSPSANRLNKSQSIKSNLINLKSTPTKEY